MELKTCEYCGTAYDARLRQCPLCGRTAAGPAAPAEPERTSPVPEKSAQSAPAERPAPGRRLRQDAGAPKAARGYAGKRLRTASAPQPSDAQSAPGEAVYAIPKWMMTVLCVILGAAVLGGALLAEKVFAYPGLGQATIDAGLRGDLPLLMGIVLFSTVLVFIGNSLSTWLVRMLNRALERPDAL